MDPSCKFLLAPAQELADLLVHVPMLFLGQQQQSS